MSWFKSASGFFGFGNQDPQAIVDIGNVGNAGVIRIRGGTSGYMEIVVPAVAPNTQINLNSLGAVTFPDNTFEVYDNVNTTTKFKFELGSMNPGAVLTLLPLTTSSVNLRIPDCINNDTLLTRLASLNVQNKDFSGTENKAENWRFPNGFTPATGGGYNGFGFQNDIPQVRRGNISDSLYSPVYLQYRIEAVRAASTANVASLSGTTTIDGVSLIAGDRVLLKDQSTASQNGVYVIQSGAWIRAADFVETGDFYTGAKVYVTEGSTQANTEWEVTTAGAITVGTTPIAFRTSSIIYYDSAASAGGSATETLTITGLAASDFIVSVSQKTPGANSTAIIGWANQAANALDLTWTGDPGAGAIVRVAVRKG